MFVGELGHSDIQFDGFFDHLLFILFIFLLVLVLMNVLNGLAISDINKIEQEVEVQTRRSDIAEIIYWRQKMRASKILIPRTNNKPGDCFLRCKRKLELPFQKVIVLESTVSVRGNKSNHCSMGFVF